MSNFTIPDFAFALLPATIVTLQSIIVKEDLRDLKDQNPVRTFIKESKKLTGFQEKTISKVDVAVPLMLLSGVYFGKSTAIMGCAYAAGRAIYTNSKNEDLARAGEYFMKFNLVLLGAAAGVSIYDLLTTTREV